MNILKYLFLIRSPLTFFVLTMLFPNPVLSDCRAELSDGEYVYVAVYSNVYSGPKQSAFQLAAMLSIRNTDPKFPIAVLRVDYYDNNGALIDSYVKNKIILKPLASTDFYIREYDKRGGPGANFIVKWRSEKKVNQPVIEGIMLGMASGQGVSFTCPGQIIDMHDAAESGH
jgi:hypothetical protein